MAFKHDWETVYNKSIISFTGRNKVGGTPERNALEDVVKETVGLVASMGRLDDSNPGTSDDPATAVKVFGKELTGTFAKERAKYDKFLDVAIKLIDKAQWPQPYRELKVLKTQLNLIASKAEGALESYSKETTKAKEKADSALDKKREELRKKGMGDNQINDETYLLKAKKLLLIFNTATKTAFAKAAAAVQQIKADPTPTTYNAVMSSGGRDLSQQFLNLIKIVNDPKAKDWPLVKNMPDLSPFEDDLKAFGNGDKRTVANDASKQDVLTLTGEFSKMMKGLIPIYVVIEKEVKSMK